MADAAGLAKLSGGALDAPALPGGLGTRSAALLARQALEMGIGAALTAAVGEDPGGSGRARLLVLCHLDPQRGQEASLLWAQLSRACHQHPYELHPTRREVRALVDRAAAWIEAGSVPI